MQYKSLADIPADALAKFKRLDLNILTLIEVIEELPHEGRHYFYFRNLLWNYVRVLQENETLRDATPATGGEGGET